MNIFVTSSDPRACARALDDKRVVNQTRETAQLLCSALRLHGCDDPRLMRLAHPHHPVTKWVASRYTRWLWTYEHFVSLGLEKIIRYPNNKAHKNWVELLGILPELASKTYYEDYFPSGPLESFCNAAQRKEFNLDFTSIPNVPAAYRQYLCCRWAQDKRQPQWTNRKPPNWTLPWLVIRGEINELV